MDPGRNTRRPKGTKAAQGIVGSRAVGKDANARHHTRMDRLEDSVIPRPVCAQIVRIHDKLSHISWALGARRFFNEQRNRELEHRQWDMGLQQRRKPLILRSLWEIVTYSIC